MKRDMDLIRTILIDVEGIPDADDSRTLEFEGWTPEEVSYHIALLNEAGLVIGHDLSSSDGYEWTVRRLTWEGHEFLDSARNEFVWNEVMANIKAQGFLSTSIDIIKRSLDGVIRKRLNVD